MTCAPDDAATWKTHLMAGQIDPRYRRAVGTILGTIHADAPRHPALGELSYTSLFRTNSRRSCTIGYRPSPSGPHPDASRT